jgi:hypothetical protein
MKGSASRSRYPRFVSGFIKFIWQADVIVRTEQEFLDLTDRQNRDFRYVL